MEREGNETKLTRDKPGGSIPIFEGWCAGEVLWSPASVEVGAGDPCGSKDTKVIGVLESTEPPDNGYAGIRASSPHKVAGSVVQLKCIYSNTGSMGNKQEELEPIVPQCDIATIKETWWGDSHNVDCLNGWL